MLVPRKAYLTRGLGRHREQLVAFELALRDAGVAAQNLVAVSSILPPGCEIVDRSEGEGFLIPGQILHVVMSRHESNVPGQQIGASVGIARPVDRGVHGFISEHHDAGLTEEGIGSHAEDLAATMLATTLGLDFDPDLPWAERAAQIQASGQVLETGSRSVVARVEEDGHWTCALSLAVFLMDFMLER